MATDFQRRKISGVFTAMDADGDGFLDETDFRALTRRWTELRGSPPGSADHTRLTTIMMGWWLTLLAASGGEGDERVTLDDVLLVVDRLDEAEDAVRETATTVFEAVDHDGDGLISAAEHRVLVEAWSGRPTDTGEVFPLLDPDGDGYVSEEEFVELWTQFWAGDDPDAPGTWVFGRFEQPVSGR